jgi:hypothetical protein
VYHTFGLHGPRRTPHLQRRGAVPSVVSHALGNRPDMNIAVICVPAFPSVAMGMRGRRCSIPASRQGNKPPHLFLSERPINSFLCKATAKSHDPKNASTFGALERSHPAPSSERRDSFQYPRDIAVAALALGIHGAAPLVASPQHYGESFTRALILGTVVFRGSRIFIKDRNDVKAVRLGGRAATGSGGLHGSRRPPPQ